MSGKKHVKPKMALMKKPLLERAAFFIRIGIIYDADLLFLHMAFSTFLPRAFFLFFVTILAIVMVSVLKFVYLALFFIRIMAGRALGDFHSFFPYILTIFIVVMTLRAGNTKIYIMLFMR